MPVIAVLDFDMNTMTALEAKNSFGKLLSAAEREPVMLTKNSRKFGALISMNDLDDLAQAYLPASELERVERGEGELITALLKHARINQKIAQSRRDIVQGKTTEMDTSYFDGLRARVLARQE